VPATSAQVRDRLTSGMRQVDGLPVLIVSGIAALVMTGGALALRRHHEGETDEHDLSVTAVLLDTVADAATGVAATGAIILPTDGGWYRLDPAVALTIAFIAFHAIALIRKVLIRLGPAVADGSGDPSGTSAPRRRVGESRK
jgi:cobalt-zinc-cadmium efflux system protein